MTKKNDIGTLFENKLKEGEQSPNSNLWKKIDTSLEKEERKKKKLLFYWTMGLGIFSLIGFWILFGNSFTTPMPPINPSTQSVKTEINNNQDFKNEESSSKINVDSTGLELTKTKKMLEVNTVEKDSIEQVEISRKISENSPIPASKKNTIDETFQVSKKYYYYNSSDGKQIVTENKNEIDSLATRFKKEIDSTNLNKKDTLN
ncbi:hypothetical protein [Aequorivita flava]|uniref:Uncharacterized protein n=1 Tax=Aequorivita flava TaxID=3114371 RepID=A0AB35YZ46_9FLAO